MRQQETIQVIQSHPPQGDNQYQQQQQQQQHQVMMTSNNICPTITAGSYSHNANSRSAPIYPAHNWNHGHNSNSNNNLNTINRPPSPGASLTATLNSYKYLDDYEFYRNERLKQSAMKKFNFIMQSIKTKYKDCSQSAEFDADGNDSDPSDETPYEFTSFNQIIKRHRERFKQNLTLHHHR